MKTNESINKYCGDITSIGNMQKITDIQEV